MGFLHEHQRPDRDEYLEFSATPTNSNIKKLSKCMANDYGKYDYASIMHYSRYQFDYFQRLKKPFEDEIINGIWVAEIGQVEGLSREDIKCIKKVYGK